MKAEIKNIIPALSASPTNLGLAVKALIAGGSALGPDGIKRASGATPHHWTRNCDEIVSLVSELEKEPERQEG